VKVKSGSGTVTLTTARGPRCRQAGSPRPRPAPSLRSVRGCLPSTEMVPWRLAAAVLSALLLQPPFSDGSYHDPVLFPLIEASGAATGDLVAAGGWLGKDGGALIAVANTTTGELQLMAGPTPHKAYCVLQVPFVVGATTVASGDLDGDGTDELIFAGEHGITAVKPKPDPNAAVPRAARCKPLALETIAASTTIADVASVVVLPFRAGRPQLLAVLSEGSPQPFGLLTVATDSIEVAKRTDFGIPSRDGWHWRAAAATTATAGQAATAGALAAVARTSADGSVAQVHLLGGTLDPTADATVPLGNSSLMDLLLADVYGDGAPGLMIIEHDTTLHYLWPGGDSGSLAHTIVAPPGGAVAMDAGREWVSVAAGPLLAGPTVLADEVQLIGLRGPDNTHSFSVSIVVHARPEHWMRRRASLANLRGTQVCQ
jgi:hypothetical protein